MRQLVYLTSADRDLRNILRYLTRKTGDRKVGRRFVDELRAQCRKLAALPGTLGTARPELFPEIRSFPFKGYVIFFRYADERFEVVDVLEGHLDIIGFFGGELDE